MSASTILGGVRNSPSASQLPPRQSRPESLGISPADLERVTGDEEGGAARRPVDHAVQRVALAEISWQKLLLFSLPFVGTAFAAREIHKLYQRYAHEDVPLAVHGDEKPVISASHNMGACLTACIVSTLFTAFLLSKYLQGDMLMFTLGALALNAYAYIDSANQAQTTVYHLNVTAQRKSGVFSP